MVPPFPTPLLYLWRTYNRLRGRKGSSGFGVSPIEWPDIQAFLSVTSSSLLPWEIVMIERLDDTFMAAARKATDSDV